MSILVRAAQIAATLDPTLGLELEMEFGADWQDQLDAAVKGERLIQDDVQLLSQAEFRSKYAVAKVREYAKSIGIETKRDGKNIQEAELVEMIYKAKVNIKDPIKQIPIRGEKK